MVALALAGATVLAGCGGGGGGGTEGQRAPLARKAAPSAIANAKGEVTLCAGDDGSGAHEANVKAFNRRHRSRGLSVELIELPAAVDEQLAAFERRRRATSARCDLLSADVTWTAELASQGRLVDLTDYLHRRESEFIPSTLETVRYADKLWGVPKQTYAGLIYYRTDDTGARAPSTWQALYDRAAETDGYVYGAAAYEGLTVHFLELAYAAGGRVLSDDGSRSLIDSPENVRVLRFMVDGIGSQAVPQAVTRLGDDGARRAFRAGNATLMRNWPFAYGRIEQSRIGDEFAVAPLPEWEGGTNAGILAGRNLVISAYSTNPGGALAVIDFLTSAEQLERDAVRFALPPVLKATYQSSAVKKALPFSDELLEAVRQAKSRPITPVYPQVSRAIYVNVNAALAGELSPEEALREAERQMNRALADALASGS